jgi:hypothetical protein
MGGKYGCCSLYVFLQQKGRSQKAIEVFEKSYDNMYTKCTPPTCSSYKIGFYFLAGNKYIVRYVYSLRSDLSNEVSLDIPSHLKKKVRGGCALPGADKQKPYTPKCGQGKTFASLYV